MIFKAKDIRSSLEKKGFIGSIQIMNTLYLLSRKEDKHSHKVKSRYQRGWRCYTQPYGAAIAFKSQRF